MFLLTRPGRETIRRFITAQAEQPFSYSDVGATGTGEITGYQVDHNRIKLGRGDRVFSRGVDAIRGWEMFNLGWVTLCWPDAVIEPGSVVAVLVSHLGFYSLNGCRIIYVIDEDGPVKRYGFAYGTLPDHAERGEERFTVEWRRDDDSVWYDILAFSRPNRIASQVGYPVTRLLQKRFARDSKEAMLRACSPS